MTTYKLPFDGKIRIASTRRFVLVRDVRVGPDTHFVIIRRSDSRETLVREYAQGTDYIIDQTTGRVTYHFNGHQEAFDSKTGKELGRTGSYTARTLHGQVEV